MVHLKCRESPHFCILTLKKQYYFTRPINGNKKGTEDKKKILTLTLDPVIQLVLSLIKIEWVQRENFNKIWKTYKFVMTSPSLKVKTAFNNCSMIHFSTASYDFDMVSNCNRRYVTLLKVCHSFKGMSKFYVPVIWL